MAQLLAHRQSDISCGAARGLHTTDISKLLKVWQHRFNSRRQLRELDARLLNDIGLDTRAAQREADKPFWVA